MANILNIETSTDVCSVAFTQEGAVLEHHEEYKGQNHAKVLSPFIESVLKYSRSRSLSIDAVAVSIGPGSYTGLRIGLSEAKGLCFGLGVPLIGVNTLQLLTVSAMFNHFIDDESALFVPMIDARRSEVYTAVFNLSLKAVVEPRPLILDADSFCDIDSSKHLYLFGNGSDKAKDIIKRENVSYIDGIKPVAIDMMALAERAFRAGDFIDVAYSTPAYLKDFHATKPRKLL
ncbi:MAG: tRNA (adenosine(37)-N6)-threonylcarbamoyltransferase complex dimerization subunit type 1 TsaB [Muribaculaceae bacterium]|jgi:tRNA threonylcarbamoyladenosine biosynthesis protein TsaB|nr:tRNA (adenosine(37)-N6)-threonylcarbamoyltransferase complex dimerization subunit type 1 TsaB [Muribaculaceae bacterium]